MSGSNHCRCPPCHLLPAVGIDYLWELHTYRHMKAHTHTHTHTHTHENRHTHTHTHARKQAHPHIHTHTHTHNIITNMSRIPCKACLDGGQTTNGDPLGQSPQLDLDIHNKSMAPALSAHTLRVQFGVYGIGACWRSELG